MKVYIGGNCTPKLELGSIHVKQPILGCYNSIFC
uniref:Uncharacterized protein n=1 Tax=Arundo donax TaxID=35708 RepID=A0A0A9SFT1_ARUDO